MEVFEYGGKCDLNRQSTPRIGGLSHLSGFLEFGDQVAKKVVFVTNHGNLVLTYI